ncbi:MAG: PTS sugar transporter subunit IIA [Oscillospiraceae bacterium]|nr:PTS sugar transporter subunit IIA [Oscillospiraceae bacterium]
MIAKLIGREGHFLTDIECSSWEELVDITGEPLIRSGSVEPEFLDSVKEAVEKYGAYMVLIDDVAFLHGRPEAGVHELAMSLALLKTPVHLLDKRVKAAFMFAAVDNTSHRGLLKELAGFMNDDEFLELLRDGKDPNAIMKKIEEDADL